MNLAKGGSHLEKTIQEDLSPCFVIDNQMFSQEYAPFPQKRYNFRHMSTFFF